MTIGEYLKQYRKQKDLTQEQLAKILWISRTHVSMLELNKREMGVMLMNTLNKRLGTKWETLNEIARSQASGRS